MKDQIIRAYDEARELLDSSTELIAQLEKLKTDLQESSTWRINHVTE